MAAMPSRQVIERSRDWFWEGHDFTGCGKSRVPGGSGPQRL